MISPTGEIWKKENKNQYHLMEERKINVFAKTLFKKNNSMKNGSKNIANLSSTQSKTA